MLLHKASQQSDLPRVIDIMKRNSVKLSQQFHSLRRSHNLFHGGAQRAVLPLEQFLIGPPGRFTQLRFFGPWEKVAPFQDKRASFSALDPSSHCVFPVRRVQRQFPDVVPVRPGSPRCLLGTDSPEGLLEIGSVPGPFLVTLVEQCHHQFRVFHRRLFLQRKLPVRRLPSQEEIESVHQVFGLKTRQNRAGLYYCQRLPAPC